MRILEGYTTIVSRLISDLSELPIHVSDGIRLVPSTKERGQYPPNTCVYEGTVFESLHLEGHHPEKIKEGENPLLRRWSSLIPLGGHTEARDLLDDWCTTIQLI